MKKCVTDPLQYSERTRTMSWFDRYISIFIKILQYMTKNPRNISCVTGWANRKWVITLYTYIPATNVACSFKAQICVQILIEHVKRIKPNNTTIIFGF